MADSDLKKNIKKMESSGYFKEDLKIDVGKFSLESLLENEDEKPVKKKSNNEKGKHNCDCC